MNPLTRKKVLKMVKAAQERGQKPDFSGTHLSQTDLSGACLSGAYFIGADLIEANLNQANLIDADLSQAHLSRAHLRGANLGAAFLSKAKLGQADLIGAHLRRAHLIGADLSQTDLSGADLSQTNLSGANLSGANLSGADLSQASLIWTDLSQAHLIGADLSQANFSEADLSQADLCGADLSQADLFRAKFSGANLCQANLIWADLSQANLSGANLSQANLNKVKLEQADFSRAVLGLTSLGDIDMKVVKGLDSIKHRGPSTLGADTLFRSRGQIPEAFLRGCGLSDVQIETAKLNNPGLTSDQITAITHRIQELLFEQALYSCFISYASQDEVFVQHLHDNLQQQGIRCWFASGGMKIGDDNITGSTIDHPIRLQDRLLLILSEISINSEWIEQEVKTALREEDRRGQTVLFPIRLDETIMETGQTWAVNLRHTRRIGDFSQWQDPGAYQQSLAQLLQDLAGGEK
jgi:uncharacterized protein YjbI with pentapeptide repeats